MKGGRDSPSLLPQSVMPSGLGLSPIPVGLSNDLADINLSSHVSGSRDNQAAPLSAVTVGDITCFSSDTEPPRTFITIDGYRPLSAPRGLVHGLEEPQCDCRTISFLDSKIDHGTNELHMNVLITGDEYNYNPVLQRTVHVHIEEHFGSIRTTVRGRIIRESNFPLKVHSYCECQCVCAFLEAYANLDYFIDLAEVAVGEHCGDALLKMSWRNDIVRRLSLAGERLFVPCVYENQGKTWRHKASQEPENAEKIRSYLCRMEDINGKIVSVEESLGVLEGEAREKAICRLLILNERARRMQENARQIFRGIYPSIDFRVRGFVKYENHALDFSLIKNYVTESVDHLPTLLGLFADGLSILHHLSCCNSRTSYFIFVSGLIGRFAPSSESVSDLATFVMDAVMDEYDDEGGPIHYDNQSFDFLDVSCADGVVSIMKSQWRFLKKILAVFIVLMVSSRKEVEDVGTKLVSMAIAWTLGFSCGIADLPKLVVDVFTELSVRMYRVYSTGDVSLLFSTPPSIMSRSIDFCNNATSMVTKMDVMENVTVPMEMAELLVEGEDLIKQLGIAIETSSATPDGLSARGHALTMLKEVNASYRQLRHFTTMPSRRRCPMGILLHGPAGVGKSEIVPSVISVALHNVAGVEYKPSLVTPINPLEAFQSTANSQHLAIVIDDMGQSPDPQGLGAKLIFDLISNNPFYYVKAEANMKGTTPCMAQVVVVTSNDINLGTAGTVKCPSALARRFVVIDMKLKPECIGEDGRFYANPDFQNDYWITSLLLRTPGYSPRTDGSWDPNEIVESHYVTSDGVECKDVSMSVCLKGLAELAIEHRRRQESVEALTVNNALTTVCSTCNVVSAYCQCGHAFENQWFTSSMRRKQVCKPRRKLTERIFAVEAREPSFFDRLWLRLPGVISLESFFLRKLIGGHDKFLRASTTVSNFALGFSLFSMAYSGPGIVSVVLSSGCAVIKKSLGAVRFMSDVSAAKPKDKNRQSALVRRMAQFSAVGGLLATSYGAFKLYVMLRDFLIKNKTACGIASPDSRTEEAKVPCVASSPISAECKSEPLVNQNADEDVATEGDTSSGEIPLGSNSVRPNTWRIFSDLPEMRKVTGGDLTIDHKVVLRRVRDAMCRVYVMQDEQKLSCVHGFVPVSNVLLVNNHAIQKGNSLRIEFSGGNIANSVKKAPLHPRLVHVLPDPIGGNKDLAMVSITSMPAMRDLRRFISDGVVNEGPAIFNRYTNSGVETQKVLVESCLIKQPFTGPSDEELYSHMTAYSYYMSIPSEPGDCGSLIMSTGATPRVLGMHACGYKNNAIGVAFTRGDIDRGLERLKNQDQMFNHGLVLDLVNIPELVTEENPLSFIHRAPPESNNTPIGRTAVKIVRPKFNTRDYGLREKMGLGTAVFGPPKRQPTWMRNFETLGVAGSLTKCNPDLDLLRKAVDDYLYTVESRVSREVFSKARLLTLDELLNGVPELGIPGIDFSKSAGFTNGKLGGPKLQYVVLNDIGRYELTPELQVMYDEYEKRFWDFSNDHVPNFIYNAFAKDELRKHDAEGNPKPYRSIFAEDFLGLILECRVKKALLVTAIAEQPFCFETALGLNMYRDTHAMVEYLKLKEGESTSVAGDFPHFDQRKDETMQMVERYISLKFMELCPNFSVDDVQYAGRVLFSVNSSPILMGDELVKVVLGPSGKYGTFFDNCLSCSIYPRMAFFKKYPDAKVGDFGSTHRLLTGGDDHVMKCLSKDRYVGMLDLASFLDSIGVGYTDPHKERPTMQFCDDFDIEFFKRGLTSSRVLCDHPIEFFIGKLDKDSIGKTLLGGNRQIYDGDGSPAEKEKYLGSAMSCLMESMLHGEAFYEEVRSKLRDLFHEWEISDWVRDDQFSPYGERVYPFIDRMISESKERALEVDW